MHPLPSLLTARDPRSFFLLGESRGDIRRTQIHPQTNMPQHRSVCDQRLITWLIRDYITTSPVLYWGGQKTKTAQAPCYKFLRFICFWFWFIGQLHFFIIGKIFLLMIYNFCILIQIAVSFILRVMWRMLSFSEKHILKVNSHFQ